MDLLIEWLVDLDLFFLFNSKWGYKESSGYEIHRLDHYICSKKKKSWSCRYAKMFTVCHHVLNFEREKIFRIQRIFTFIMRQGQWKLFSECHKELQKAANFEVIYFCFIKREVFPVCWTALLLLPCLLLY